MSSAAPPKPVSPAPPRPVPPPPGAFSTGGPAIDPIKLLKKWKYVLGASVFVGLVLGVIGHFIWLFTYPMFDSVVTYETRPPQDSSLLEPTAIDQEALERFMATQADRMLSTTILERVTQDPRLITEAPNWSAPFVQSDQSFDFTKALQELRKRASATPVRGTNYIRLKVTWKNPRDAASMARLISEAYLNDLRQRTGLENNQRRDAIQRSINDIRQEIDNMTERRGRLIRDEEVTSIVEQATTTREKLSLIARERNIQALEMRAVEVQLARMNEMIQSESGVRYSDMQRASVESSAIIMQMKSSKEALETRLKELRRASIMPGHREYRRVENQIAALEQQISVTKERELARLFDAEKDMLESMLRQAHAKEADLLAREQQHELRLQDLTRTIREINDITNQIGQLNSTLADRRRALEDVQTTASMETASRIEVVESARVADRPTHPQLFLMAAMGIFLVSGLVGGSILAAEFLDQRVKSASDLATMSKTRVLGTVPLAEEDPTANGPFETVFRDSDKSVIAESFRQIRTGLLKHMSEGGHKTCLIVGGMPGSGSTAMVINLGDACAAVDRRVLLVDANFRRPSLHRTLGLKESPGLGDVLASKADLEQVVQRSGENLDVLTVGSAEHRVFERLGTQPMTEMLARAGTKYDLVFLDTAPTVVAGDAMSIAQRCDATVLITRALAEKRGMVARIKNELNDAPAEMIGIIVNAVRSAAGGYMKRNIRTSTAYHAAETRRRESQDLADTRSARDQGRNGKS